jgi:hypothetical protein
MKPTVTIFDCCKQSLKRLLHPPTHPHIHHPSIHPGTWTNGAPALFMPCILLRTVQFLAETV